MAWLFTLELLKMNIVSFTGHLGEGQNLLCSLQKFVHSLFNTNLFADFPLVSSATLGKSVALFLLLHFLSFCPLKIIIIIINFIFWAAAPIGDKVL